jgi:hypothetical protein
MELRAASHRSFILTQNEMMMQASILVPTIALISISNEQLRTAAASSMNVAEGRKT